VVKVPDAGRIAVRGSLVRSLSRSVRKAGTYRLRVRLTARARRSLEHRHVLRLRLRVVYRSVGGASSTASLSIRVKAR
jgi:hypothetical protein